MGGSAGGGARQGQRQGDGGVSAPNCEPTPNGLMPHLSLPVLLPLSGPHLRRPCPDHSQLAHTHCTHGCTHGGAPGARLLNVRPLPEHTDSAFCPLFPNLCLLMIYLPLLHSLLGLLRLHGRGAAVAGGAQPAGHPRPHARLQRGSGQPPGGSRLAAAFWVIVG